MLLPTHKYLIKRVGNPQLTKGGHTFVEIILVKPAKPDEFGEKHYPDDIYRAIAWNETAKSLPVLNHGDKVEAMLNLRGEEDLDTRNGNTYYNCKLIIRNIEKIVNQPANQ